MLEQSDSLCLDKLLDHIAQHSADCVEPLVGLTDVGESHLIEQDLLDNKDRNCLGQLRASLHDAQAEGNDLCREEKVDDIGIVVLLDESANDTERG